MSGPVQSNINDWFMALPEGRQAILRDDQWMLAHAAFEAGRQEAEALRAVVAVESALRAKAEMHVAMLQRLGAPLANIAYNLAQREGEPLTAAYCSSLREAQLDWDAARKSAPVADISLKDHP